jgi:menaquinone-dependent protoporphyrinogen oxidase
MVKAVDHRVFSGRIDLGRLGFAERAVVKALRAPVGDYRDWDAITAWAVDIATALGSSQSAVASQVMVDTPSD